MPHIPVLIIDLALILGAAGITTLLFRYLKQPLVLGYILSGLLVGPHITLVPSVTDLEGIQVWAEMGVIFLLFSLGLEFSFKKLAKVGAAAGITGAVEISAMMLLGYLVGGWMGWPIMDRIFLGGIIAISSTTIIFRAFEELGLKTRQFTSLVFGVLIVEDLVAILLMVLAGTMAISREIAGTDLLIALGRLLFFLTIWFLLGIYLLPSLLRKAARWMSDETLLLLAMALCLGMVVLAGSVGFSAALGAFVMGSILSETLYGERIEHLMGSVRHFFGAIFFVSVGMLINPATLWEHAGTVLLLTLAVVGGKLLFVATGSLLAGKPLRQALQAGTSMTQIGEFSFIIATLGLQLKLIGEHLYPVAVGVSVITTFFTPYMMQLAEPLNRRLLRILPGRWLRALDKYSTGSQRLHGDSHWQVVLKAYGQLLFVHGILCIACILLSRYVLRPALANWLTNGLYASVLAVVISLLAMAPFVWALAARKIEGISYKALWLDSKYNRGPLVMLEIGRNVIALTLVGFLIGQHFPIGIVLAITAVVIPIVVVIFRQKLQQYYHRIEDHFVRNLNQRQTMAASPLPKTLSPWDTHLTPFAVHANSFVVGKSLEELAIRESLGINIAFIERGHETIFAPKHKERLYPGDMLGVIGTDAAMQAFLKLVQPSEEGVALHAAPGDEVVLERLTVDQRTRLRGLSIRDSGIREKTDGLVVGIERQGRRILNPPSDTVLEWEDVVWLVGRRSKILAHYVHPD